MQSPIVNYCLKVNIDGHTEPQLVPKFLLQVSVIELRNSFVSYTEDAGLKEAIDVENNIIVSDYKLSSFLPTQFKKCHQDTNSFVVVIVLYLPKVYISR